MTKKETRSFELEGEKYLVRHPNMEEHVQADKIYKKTWNEELQSGSLLRSQLESELRSRELWSDKLEEEYQTTRREMIELEFALTKGGIKLSEAKDLAMEMKEKRNTLVNLLSTRTDLDSNTCEGRADSAKFNYLLSKCLLKEDKSPVFAGGVAEYLERQNEVISNKGATEFYYLMSDANPSDDGLLENKFLKKYNFSNDKNQLIDKEGRLVDMNGKHIDEEGYYIKWISDTESIKVDVEGRPLDGDGNFIVEFSPFLDDDGTPIEVEAEEDKEEVEEAKPRKRKSKPAAKKEETIAAE